MPTHPNLTDLSATSSPAIDAFLVVDPDTQLAMVMEDFKAGYQLLEAGGLDAYGGQCAAFLEGQLVGTGPESWDLRMKVSRERQVHPERLAVIHVINDVVLLS